MEKTIDAHCATAVVAAETPPPSSLITLGDTLSCPGGHGSPRWVHRAEGQETNGTPEVIRRLHHNQPATS